MASASAPTSASNTTTANTRQSKITAATNETKEHLMEAILNFTYARKPDATDRTATIGDQAFGGTYFHDALRYAKRGSQATSNFTEEEIASTGYAPDKTKYKHLADAKADLAKALVKLVKLRKDAASIDLSKLGEGVFTTVEFCKEIEDLPDESDIESEDEAETGKVEEG